MQESQLPTLKDAFFQLKQKLIALYDEQEVAQIVEMAMAKVSGMSRSERICSPEKAFSEIQWQQWTQIELELLANRPVQYILGTADFYGLSLFVDESVLIPRPETEELVNLVLKDIRPTGQSAKGLNILDIGTGSGCIALALKKNLPQAEVFACDISEPALATAKRNAIHNDLKISFLNWNILENNLPTVLPQLDIIVSNPPYITIEEKSTMLPNVLSFEPHSALFVTNMDPLQFYKRIEIIGRTLLKPSGKIYLELNENYAQETCGYYQGQDWKASIKQDFQGKNRMLAASN